MYAFSSCVSPLVHSLFRPFVILLFVRYWCMPFLFIYCVRGLFYGVSSCFCLYWVMYRFVIHVFICLVGSSIISVFQYLVCCLLFLHICRSFVSEFVLLSRYSVMCFVRSLSRSLVICLCMCVCVCSSFFMFVVRYFCLSWCLAICFVVRYGVCPFVCCYLFICLVRSCVLFVVIAFVRYVFRYFCMSLCIYIFYFFMYLLFVSSFCP